MYLIENSTVSECSGNIFCAKKVSGFNFYCTGILLDDENSSITKMDSNVFAGFNNCFFGIYETVEEGTADKGYHNDNLTDLESKYTNYTNTKVYDTMTELNLTSIATTQSSSTGPLAPTSSTPVEICKCSTLQTVLSTDILSNPRTSPYTIVAYEYD